MWHPKVPLTNSPASKATLSPRLPSHNPPSPSPHGTLSTVAPCCPDVATFTIASNDRSTYFGFDDKTTLVENVGVDEYWIPPTKKKRLRSNKEFRDGAPWVSVGIGLETHLKINFRGTYSNSCLSNCSYKVDPPHIAEVTSAKPTATGADFNIKGKADGEASLKVMCNGNLIGYFHIWCKAPAVIRIGVGTIKVTNTLPTGNPFPGDPPFENKPPLAELPPFPKKLPFPKKSPFAQVPAFKYSIPKIQSVLKNVFRQALLSFSITDLGTVNFDLADARRLRNVQKLVFGTRGSLAVFDENGVVNSAFKDNSDASKWWAASLHTLSLMAHSFSKNTSPPKYTIWFLAAPNQDIPEGISGVSLGSLAAEAFIFTTGDTYSNTIAHELGHMLGLHHPNDKPDNSAQFPDHLTDGATKEQNWDSDDKLNLMGYGHPRSRRGYLRYRQWKALRLREPPPRNR